MDNTAPYPILQSGEMLNWYKIEHVLGRGGFGVIYLATDTNLDHLVAIKEYRVLEVAGNTGTHTPTGAVTNNARQGMQRFIAEARNLVKFKHPNIVRVMSVFEQNDTAYIVMEFEEGIDLREFLNDPKRKRESVLKALLVPIADGLSQVHQSGFIHRDIKPANILVRKNGSPVLLDFGSARSSEASNTEPLTALVSAGYAPLEQYSGDGDKDQGPWTDIYALGAVLYFAVTGMEPIDSAKRASAILNGGKDPLISARLLGQAEYSAEFLSAIDWALQFRISDRPQSLSVWLNALLKRGTANQPTRQVSSRAQPLQGVSMQDVPAPQEVQSIRVKRKRSRSLWLRMLGLSLAGLLLVGGVVFVLFNGSEFFNITPRESTASSDTENVNALPNTASIDNVQLQLELENARNEAKALAVELIREQEKLKAQELERQKSEAEREASFAANLKAAEAAEIARQRTQRRRFTQELNLATRLLDEGKFDSAEAALDRASRLDSEDGRLIQLRARWRIALEMARAPVSDREFSQVVSSFDELRRAIQNGEINTINRLTAKSNQNDLFRQLINRFASLQVTLMDIELNNSTKSISAVLRINRMTRDNGDVAIPSPSYQDRRLSSRRIGRQWSLIQW